MTEDMSNWLMFWQMFSSDNRPRLCYACVNVNWRGYVKCTRYLNWTCTNKFHFGGCFHLGCCSGDLSVAFRASAPGSASAQQNGSTSTLCQRVSRWAERAGSLGTRPLSSRSHGGARRERWEEDIRGGWRMGEEGSPIPHRPSPPSPASFHNSPQFVEVQSLWPGYSTATCLPYPCTSTQNCQPCFCPSLRHRFYYIESNFRFLSAECIYWKKYRKTGLRSVGVQYCVFFFSNCYFARVTQNKIDTLIFPVIFNFRTMIADQYNSWSGLEKRIYVVS